MLGAAGLIGADGRVPAMVLLRAPLGRRGSYAATGLNVVQCLGWATFEIIIIAAALTALSDELLGFGANAFWTLVTGAVALLPRAAGPGRRRAARDPQVRRLDRPRLARLPDLVGARGRRPRGALERAGRGRHLVPRRRRPRDRDHRLVDPARGRLHALLPVAPRRLRRDGARLLPRRCLDARARRAAGARARDRRGGGAAGRRRRRWGSQRARPPRGDGGRGGRGIREHLLDGGFAPEPRAGGGPATARRRRRGARHRRRADDRARQLRAVPAPARLVLRAALRRAARGLAARRPLATRATTSSADRRSGRGSWSPGSPGSRSTSGCTRSARRGGSTCSSGRTRRRRRSARRSRASRSRSGSQSSRCWSSVAAARSPCRRDRGRAMRGRALARRGRRDGRGRRPRRPRARRRRRAAAAGRAGARVGLRATRDVDASGPSIAVLVARRPPLLVSHDGGHHVGGAGSGLPPGQGARVRRERRTTCCMAGGTACTSRATAARSGARSASSCPRSSTWPGAELVAHCYKRASARLVCAPWSAPRSSRRWRSSPSGLARTWRDSTTRRCTGRRSRRPRGVSTRRSPRRATAPRRARASARRGARRVGRVGGAAELPLRHRRRDAGGARRRLGYLDARPELVRVDRVAARRAARAHVDRLAARPVRASRPSGAAF